MKSTIKEVLPPFNPAPWCLNGHSHTIFTSLLTRPLHVNYKRTQIDTPDGDLLELDLLENHPNSPVSILLHGLEGSSGRYYIQNLARQLYDTGHTVAALNFRSCGSGLNSKRRFYHSGETEDLDTVSQWLEQKYPGSVQLAAGFSLGGSVLLNYLKRYNSGCRIRSFAAVSVPYDLYRGSVNLQSGFNRVYDYRFLRSLKKKLELKRRRFNDLPRFRGSTLFEFDDQITAPIHGFIDAEDYYNRCSSAFFMDQIRTPGLLLHSKADPLCPFEYTPVQSIRDNPFLHTVFTDRGGHVGFWSLPPGWVEQTITHYFNHFLANGQNSSP